MNVLQKNTNVLNTFKNENVITTGNIKLFVCDICNDTYSLQRSFKLHYRAHKSFPCEVCNQVFTLKQDLNFHLRTHKFTDNDTKQKYICTECNREFLSKYKVKEHMKCHKRYICKLCKAEFSNMNELRGHKIIHKTHVCNGCYEIFRLKSELRGHVCASVVQEFKPSDAAIKYLKHPDVKQEVFDIEDALQSCSESHEKEKSYSDDMSRTVVKQEAGNSSSSRDKPYFCVKCEKSFRRYSPLISHRCTIKKKPRKYVRKSISTSF